MSYRIQKKEKSPPYTMAKSFTLKVFSMYFKGISSCYFNTLLP